MCWSVGCESKPVAKSAEEVMEVVFDPPIVHPSEFAVSKGGGVGVERILDAASERP